MADSQANLDVEDVLSSIRRLVTQGDKAPKASDPGPGKLVLTPAHRVTPTTPSGAETAGHPTGPSSATELEDAIVELEAAVSGIEARFEPEIDAESFEAEVMADFDEPFLIDSDEDDPAAGEAQSAADSAEATAETEAADTAEDVVAEHEAVEAVEAPAETVATGTAEVVVSDTEEATDDAQGPEIEAQAEAVEAIEEEVTDEAPVAEPESGSIAEVTAPDDEAVEAPEAGDAPVDEAIAGGAEPAAQAGEEAEALAANTSAVDEDRRGREEALAAVPDPEEPVSDAVPESAPIDPEMLYAMVAEIVRAELQGSLGERLTDRIRKLVRREIQLALENRDDQ